jgi:hypothetical protein
MPSFAYTNPYSSTPPSLENALQSLVRSSRQGGIPSLSVVQTVQGQLATASETEIWTVDQAQRLTQFVLRLASSMPKNVKKEIIPIPQGVLASLYLWMSAMEQGWWSDSIVYAVFVDQQQEDNGITVSDMLYRFISIPQTYTVALVGLARVWRTLDRLQSYTTSCLDPTHQDTPWWILPDEKTKLRKLASMAVTRLCRYVSYFLLFVVIISHGDELCTHSARTCFLCYE